MGPAGHPKEYLANILAAVRDPHHPTQIGPYFIEELIGEGGMGSVYKAEQRQPIKRTVAIKVIKLGMDTRQVIARFESERQALALMNHPNVARVIDAGATDAGRPYFVMEFVAGEPITSFCDRAKYTVQQRLELFTQACDAVQHAHQKAIIHRDLKPSNILVMEVDGKPHVKVIDFGVAKAISQRLTEKSLFTETGQLIGTPEYMAPEQAEGNALDVDTRTDVYSLGVVLYELLIGALPFDAATLRSAGYNEIQRIIREVDPPRPSTKLSSLGKSAQQIAESRQTQLAMLHQQLKSELEWIPLKAMRKEPVQRYSSPLEMAEDIANYLAHRPLRAGPESRAYRARKFLRRNKAGVAASAGMILLLLGGIIATAWQAIRATRAERATRAALVEVQQQKQRVEDASVTVSDVNQFLVNMLAQANPYQSKGQKVTVLEVLDAAAARIEGGLKRQPLAEAAIRTVLSASYAQLGRPDPAVAHAQVAVDIRRRLLGNNNVDTLASISELAFALKKLGKLTEAEPLCIEAMEGDRRLLGEDDPATLTATSNLAVLLAENGKLNQAIPLLRTVLEKRRRILGNEHPDTYQSLNNLASALRNLNELAEAEALYREALAQPGSAVSEDHPDRLKVLHNLATALKEQGKVVEAERLFRESLERSRRVLGPDHLDTLISLEALATMLHDQGKFNEAEPMYRHALDAARRSVGPDHFNTLTFEHNLATLMADQGKLDEAEASFADVLERRRRTLSADHPNTLTTMHRVASLLFKRGRLAEAEVAWREVADARRRVLGPEHPDTLSSVYGVVLVLRDEGKLAEAESICRELVNNAKRGMGETKPNTLSTMITLAQLLETQGKFPESEIIFRTVYQTRRQSSGNEHPSTLGSQDSLIIILAEQKKWDDALPLAKQLYENVQGVGEGMLAPQLRGQYLSDYGVCLTRMERFQDAIDPLTEARTALRAGGDRNRVVSKRVLDALVTSCEKANRPDDAQRWRAELAAFNASTQPASQPSTRASSAHQ